MEAKLHKARRTIIKLMNRVGSLEGKVAELEVENEALINTIKQNEEAKKEE